MGTCEVFSWMEVKWCFGGVTCAIGMNGNVMGLDYREGRFGWDDGG